MDARYDRMQSKTENQIEEETVIIFIVAVISAPNLSEECSQWCFHHQTSMLCTRQHDDNSSRRRMTERVTVKSKDPTWKWTLSVSYVPLVRERRLSSPRLCFRDDVIFFYRPNPPSANNPIHASEPGRRVLLLLRSYGAGQHKRFT